jgi:hypothetical protein
MKGDFNGKPKHLLKLSNKASSEQSFDENQNTMNQPAKVAVEEVDKLDKKKQLTERVGDWTCV